MSAGSPLHVDLENTLASEVLDYGSWGGVFKARQRVAGMRDRTRALPLPESGSVLPYGVGRSYGDSCLNDGNTLLRARDLDRFISFDASTGLLRAESGVLLGEIVAFALPRGFFLPVTPGTKFVTLGGAIANDVHGKNHHRAGSFGRHVERFELLRSDGSRTVCAPGRDAALHRATIGGLGLTGLITWAEIRLRPVKGSWMRQRAIRFHSLGEFFALCEPLEREHEYTVAWLDCASGGERTRGVFFAGDHDDRPGLAKDRVPRRFPVQPPFSLVNNATLRVFNEVYYRAPRGGERDARTVSYDPFFYPLDSLLAWNRLYGPRGFYQYQCAVPGDEAGRGALAESLKRISASGEGSFLAVLKRFGDMPAAGMMSFPRPGYTFALDFPNRGDRTLKLLDSLDDVVMDAGGRVYAAKDGRMSPRAFRAFYPQWEEFAAHVDPRFSSSFWRRVTA